MSEKVRLVEFRAFIFDPGDECRGTYRNSFPFGLATLEVGISRAPREVLVKVLQAWMPTLRREAEDDRYRILAAWVSSRELREDLQDHF